MLTRSFHNALCDIRRNGITVEEAITKHGEWMVDGEEEKLMKMFRKSRTTQRSHGTGNNAKASHITSITVPTGCKIRKLKKSAKPCNSKGFAGSLYSENVYYYFEIKGNDAYIEKGFVVGGTSEDVKSGHFTIDEARKCYKALKDKGFTTKKSEIKKAPKASNSKASSSKKSRKTDSKKTKGNTKKTKTADQGRGKKTTKTEFIITKGNMTYRFCYDTKTRMIVTGYFKDADGITYMDYAELLHISDARGFYRMMLKQGFKAA